MADVSSILKQLKQERDRVAKQPSGLNAALKAQRCHTHPIALTISLVVSRLRGRAVRQTSRRAMGIDDYGERKVAQPSGRDVTTPSR